MKLNSSYIISFIFLVIISCSKNSNTQADLPDIPASFTLNILKVNGVYRGFTYYNVNDTPLIEFSFSAPLNQTSISNSFSFKDGGGVIIPFTSKFANNDSTLIIQPVNALQPITKYVVTISTALKSQQNELLQTPVAVTFITAIDSTDKFQLLSDSALLDLVQQQTFKYFWDFGHPLSGMARERNTSGDIVTTGGTGFGIMSILAAIHRNFISRADGLHRVATITSFLKNNCSRYHGAFSHWINGSTGATVPFSTKDDGADLVETSFLLEGLLCARQYFNSEAAPEVNLRNDINELWDGVEWNWFRQNDQNVLYWHWSPNYNWEMNVPITGWNEALIPYILAASSNTDTIPPIAYNNGWARNGGIKNNNTYFGIQLPLGPSMGGPLFFFGDQPT